MAEILLEEVDLKYEEFLQTSRKRRHRPPNNCAWIINGILVLLFVLTSNMAFLICLLIYIAERQILFCIVVTTATAVVAWKVKCMAYVLRACILIRMSPG